MPHRVAGVCLLAIIELHVAARAALRYALLHGAAACARIACMADCGGLRAMLAAMQAKCIIVLQCTS